MPENEKPPVPSQAPAPLSDRAPNSIDDFDERMWAERDKPRKAPLDTGEMGKDERDEFFRDLFRPED